MTRRQDVVPDLVLERYRLGELPDAEAEALRHRLGSEPALVARLETLGASDAEIRRRYPPAWLAERIRERRREGKEAARPRLALGGRWPVPLALAAAASLLLVLAPRLVGPPGARPVGGRPTPGESADRVKGLRPALEVFRKTPDGSEALADGARVGTGDVLRVGYRAAGRRFGVILSVDGRGAVTLHLPARGEEAAALDSAGRVLLDHAYELDDAPRFERFYLVTAAEPFAVAPVVDAARHLVVTPESTRLPLAAPLEQTTFLLRKGGRP
jgi:anti-sigma factor RsiW